METKPQIDLRRRQLKTTNVTYNRIRKSAIKMEIREESKRKWQNQWKETTKGAITKEFFPSVERRLAVNLHLNPNVTTVMSGHGNIRSYLHRLTLRLLMSYIYMEHPFLMFLDHTQRRSTVGRTPLDE